MVQFFSGQSPVFAQRGPDPRSALAQALIQGGTQATPVRNPIEGLGRLASALSGAFIARTQADEEKKRSADASATLSKALAGFNAPEQTASATMPAPGAGDVTASFADFNPGSTGMANVVERELDPNEKMARLASALAGNPDLAPIAANIQLTQAMNQADAQRKAAADAAARERELRDKKVTVLSPEETRAAGIDPNLFQIEVDAFGNRTYNKISDVLSPEAEAQKARIAAAGKPSTTTTIIQEAANEGLTEEQKEAGKMRARRYNEYVTAGDVAETQLSNIRSARAASDTELPSQLQKFIGDVGAALGFSAEKMAPIVGDIDSAQKFVGSLQNLVLEKLQAQKGPQTENDARRIEKTVASLGNTPEAREFLLRFAETMALRDIERRNFYDDYMQEHGTLAGDRGSGRASADKMWGEQFGSAPTFGTNPNTGENVFLFEFIDAASKANPDMSRSEIVAKWREKYGQ